MSENIHYVQLLTVAKSQGPKALETVIEQLLGHKQIFVFGEFIAIPSVQQVSTYSD